MKNGILFFLSIWTVQCFALDIDAKMLSQGSAVLQIDGKQRMLREGARSPEGVLLVSANGKQAVIEFEGKQKTITMSRQISTQFKQPSKAEVRIAAGQGGHFFTPGRINGMPVEFIVDTGATTIAMNYHEAERLGIDYRAGTPIIMDTANGQAKAFLITLNRVSVGDIELQHVVANVNATDSPSTILLGNSYLGQVNMTIDAGVLLLKTK
jgi:aspartyl protease family protein